jgi:CheY-like chemotaxis protein
LRLRQVLINLLGNAVKFTPDNGRIELTIRAGDLQDKSRLFYFAVRDTGIGISPESLEHLFQPFEQGKNLAKALEGTGLGLAISRNIVRLFGGDITVTSKEGEGSEFSFEIRLPEAAAAVIEEVLPEDVENKLEGKRALLVDDVPINRLIARDLLEATGIMIEEAEDGLVALNLFKESPVGTYDIIYMDIQMPVMDGFQAASAIRALDREDAKTVPIVALTANAFKEDIENSLKHGINAHLAKPMEADTVLETTFRLLGAGKGGTV